MPLQASTLERVFAQAQALSLSDKVRLAERLFASIERELEAFTDSDIQASRVREWKATIERTTGALADDPIERPAQGDFERRDDIL